MIGRWEAGDWQAVGGERRGADAGDARQRGEDLPVGLWQQLCELVLRERDVGLQAAMALEVAAKVKSQDVV